MRGICASLNILFFIIDIEHIQPATSRIKNDEYIITIEEVIKDESTSKYRKRTQIAKIWVVLLIIGKGCP